MEHTEAGCRRNAIGRKAGVISAPIDNFDVGTSKTLGELPG
jgi:hypothetical protein